MAYTFRDVITNAMKIYGAIGFTETPSAEEADHALHELNSLIETWELDGLFPPQRATASCSTVDGTASYSVGDSLDLDIDRPPVELDSVQWDNNPLAQITLADMGVQNQTTLGIPRYYSYERGPSSATITLWPIPGSAQTLRIGGPLRYAEFELDDVVNTSLPSGYAPALEYSLASLLASQEGLQRPQVDAIALERFNRIKRINQHAVPLQEIMPLYNNRLLGNILTGE